MIFKKCLNSENIFKNNSQENCSVKIIKDSIDAYGNIKYVCQIVVSSYGFFVFPSGRISVLIGNDDGLYLADDPDNGIQYTETNNTGMYILNIPIQHFNRLDCFKSEGYYSISKSEDLGVYRLRKVRDLPNRSQQTENGTLKRKYFNR